MELNLWIIVLTALSDFFIGAGSSGAGALVTPKSSHTPGTPDGSGITLREEAETDKAAAGEAVAGAGSCRGPLASSSSADPLSFLIRTSVAAESFGEALAGAPAPDDDDPDAGLR